jgi:hypothetical protein
MINKNNICIRFFVFDKEKFEKEKHNFKMTPKRPDLNNVLFLLDSNKVLSQLINKIDCKKDINQTSMPHYIVGCSFNYD